MHPVIVIQATLSDARSDRYRTRLLTKNRLKAVVFNQSAPGEARTLASGSGGRRSIH